MADSGVSQSKTQFGMKGSKRYPSVAAIIVFVTTGIPVFKVNTIDSSMRPATVPTKKHFE